jgi:hypothetical protein
MTKKKAQALLDSILCLASAEASVAGEGNSGEFTDEKDAKEAREHLDKQRGEFSRTFADATGWRPTFHEADPLQWHEDWTLDRH